MSSGQYPSGTLGGCQPSTPRPAWAAAAAIMVVVFAAVIPNDQVFIKVFGVGMVAAILVDATLIRMLLVPAVMHLLGRSNWWLPRIMARRLPSHPLERPAVP